MNTEPGAAPEPPSAAPVQDSFENADPEPQSEAPAAKAVGELIRSPMEPPRQWRPVE
jgi:hypothetical protein